MPILSDWSRRRKGTFFLDRIPCGSRVLEVGCGSGWVGEYLRDRGCEGYVALDLAGPADVVGDIRDWAVLGLEAGSFDCVVAFEVVEHVDCFREMFDLLKPGGMLLLTSPVPGTDWVCRLLEWVGLAQKRGSAHDHLMNFRDIPLFEVVMIRRVGYLAQWGIFRKPEGRSAL